MPMPLPSSQNANRTAYTGTQESQQSAKAAGYLVPFTRAAKLHTELGQSFQNTLSTTTQNVPHKVPIYGYLRRLYLIVTAVTAGNAANVAFNADAPWNVINNLLVRDANGTPILNLSGYQVFQAAKRGGYSLFRPDGSSFFSTTTGAGATGGSFTLVLPLYVAFGRDGIGCLPNMDSSSQYAVDITLGTIANVYSVAPTAAPTITTQLMLEAFQNPPASDQFGNSNNTRPPAVGTVQYWSSSVFSWSGTGEQTLLLPRVGNLIRGHLLIFRTAAGARDNTVLPSVLQWEWDSSLLLYDSVLARRIKNYTDYGFDEDSGILSYMRTSDPDNVPTGEYGDFYLPTLGSTKLMLRFTPGAAGSLEVLTNDIIPVGNIYSEQVS